MGEIRITHSFKYHGKLYCFLKNDQIFSAIIGSPNLSFLKAKQDQLFNQYEIALFTNNTDTLQKSLNHIKSLKSSDVSKNISSFGGFNLLSEDELY
ncbi:NgoFVII family restriction endonuclease [Microbacterium esteraromaticum]|nr:NgoFVII family restriction endonuclease [Microbacterium esteraromaticum]